MEITKAVMSYKQFLFLLRCVRFDDKSATYKRERQATDKLAAIRSMFDEFIGNSKNTYSLSEFITVNEKLQSFRRKCSFIQYIPNKSAKYGLKLFLLTDAKTFLTSNMEIYCGKQAEGPYAESISPLDIVSRLVTRIGGSNRHVTMDNWYTNHPLAIRLLEKNPPFLYSGTKRIWLWDLLYPRRTRL